MVELKLLDRDDSLDSCLKPRIGGILTESMEREGEGEDPRGLWSEEVTDSANLGFRRPRLSPCLRGRATRSSHSVAKWSRGALGPGTRSTRLLHPAVPLQPRLDPTTAICPICGYHNTTACQFDVWRTADASKKDCCPVIPIMEPTDATNDIVHPEVRAHINSLVSAVR